MTRQAAGEKPEGTGERPSAVPSDPGRRFLSLGQWLFILGVLFLVLPLCAFQLWGYYQARRYLTAASFRDVRSAASLEASQLSLYVQHTQGLFGSAISTDEHLPILVRSLNASDGEARRQAGDELRALQRKMGGVATVEDVQISSPGGSLLASANEVADPLPDGLPCLPVGARGPVIVDRTLREGKGATLLFASAIEGNKGDPLGTVCAPVRFDFRELMVRDRREMQAHRGDTGAATMVLLDDRGNVVCGVPPLGGREVNLTRSDVARVIPALGHSWEGRYVSSDSREVLAAYEPVSALGWGVFVEEPVATALAPLRQWERETGMAAVALLLLAAAAAVFAWRKVVSPIQSLSQTAERMASGATGETVTPGGLRETAELAKSFNRMSLALAQSQHSLEQRIAERTQELRESQELSERLLDSIDHRVIAVDRNYHVVKANAAALRVYGPELVGMPCYRVFEGRSSPCEQCAAARTFATGRPASEERSENTGSGREAVEVETYPVVGSGGEVSSVIEIARIVTAEKQVQMQMMHQQKMAAFGLLAAGMAHDIGNPLAAIQSQLQIARQQPSRLGETVEVVSKEISRISRMLRELIDFTRRRRDAVMLVSVNQVVEDVVRLLGHDPRARTVDVGTTLAAQLPGIRTTEDHLFQVLLNLGLNSLDAISGGGSLEFETSARSGWVVVRVRDTGHGIPADCHEHLFEPFFTTKAPGSGTGLGLFVSRSIVESMGGDLTLEHTDERGTVFAIFLPVNPDRDGNRSV